MNEFGKEIEELGPLGSSEGKDLAEIKVRLEEIQKLIPYIKLVKKDKLAIHNPDQESYKNLFTKEEVETLIREAPSYYIAPDKCQACSICLKKCPVEAIGGGKNKIHVIDQEKCIKCGTCFESCPPKVRAVTKIVGEPVPPPVSEEARMITRK